MVIVLHFIYFLVLFCFFFFKQKTAYEMRISDWSSDVCSSDLWNSAIFSGLHHLRRHRTISRSAGVHLVEHLNHQRSNVHAHLISLEAEQSISHGSEFAFPPRHPVATRSEEHTSELQSLMRISYTAFCLKKKQTDYKYYPLSTTRHNTLHTP